MLMQLIQKNWVINLSTPISEQRKCSGYSISQALIADIIQRCKVGIIYVMYLSVLIIMF